MSPILLSMDKKEIWNHRNCLVAFLVLFDVTWLLIPRANTYRLIFTKIRHCSFNINMKGLMATSHERYYFKHKCFHIFLPGCIWNKCSIWEGTFRYYIQKVSLFIASCRTFWIINSWKNSWNLNIGDMRKSRINLHHITWKTKQEDVILVSL